ncbi:GNAT family N-acetyltransferase [Neobacillus sp. D3-1R]|uniref:GNAT family N-acetyltransferase n=1 Tax=Neobacillus sp. D3-1R TaxID=3445778 RepID=UPI003F9F636C
MKIRIANLEDAFDIATVHVESWKETYKGIMNEEFLNNLKVEDRLHLWKETLANPKEEAPVLVAEDSQGKIVGFASFGPERSEADIDGELYAIYILKSNTGQGIGSLLFNEGVKLMKSQGFSSLLVWVLAENPSKYFYESMGGKKFEEKEFILAGQNHIELSYIWKELS